MAAAESTASSLSSNPGLVPPARPEEGEGDTEANSPQGCHLAAMSDLNRHKDQSVIPRSVIFEILLHLCYVWFAVI